MVGIYSIVAKKSHFEKNVGSKQLNMCFSYIILKLFEGIVTFDIFLLT